MRVRRKLGFALTIGAILGSTASNALADERSDARAHFRAGMALIAQHRYQEGIDELEAAYAILPHPNVLYNIARAYNDMGNTERAIEYLRRYLQHDVPDRTEIEAIIARLENRLRNGGARPAVVNAGTNGQRPNAVSTGTGATSTGSAESSSGTGVTSTGTGATSTGSAESGAGSAINVPSGGPPQVQALRDAARTLLRFADQLAANPNAAMGSTAPEGAGQGETSGGTEASGGSRGTGANPSIGASREDDLYEERVVTASRAAQSPLDAPNATGVITAQDIRLSGITQVPELLRRLVGVDVMTLDNSDVQVSVRGFNQRLSNKVLVLVDGRSVYLDFLGVTLWNMLPVSVEDIERIEVIRGPGSALYGADAFTGVINIITRAPGENRNSVSAGGGNGQWIRGAYYTSGRAGGISYRTSISYEQQATFSLSIPDDDTTYYNTTPGNRDISFRAARFNIELASRLGRNLTLRGGIGGSLGRSFFHAIGPLRRFWGDEVFVQPWIQLDVGGFTGRVFWNRFHAEAAPILATVGASSFPARVEQDVVDVDAQYAARSNLGSVQNILQFGAGYRMKHISWNYLDDDHTLHFFSGYIQDTLRVSNRFSAIASVRMDVHPVLDAPVISPRVAAIFRPSERRAIRATFGTAFRTPTFLELYLQLQNPTPIPGVTVTGQGGEVDNDGNRLRLRAETAISADIGYLDQTSDRFQFEANLFFNRGADLIQLTEVQFSPLPGNNDPSRAINVGRLRFSNDPTATYVYGAEVGTRVSPIEGLDLYGNYTLAFTQHDASSLLAGAGLGPGGTPLPDQRTPQHKFNIGFQVRTRFGLDFEAFGHYASRQVWLEQVFDTARGVRYAAFEIPDYFMLNARIGYRMFNDRFDVGVVGYNLTDVRAGAGSRQHPFGSPLSLRVLATATYRF